MRPTRKNSGRCKIAGALFLCGLFAVDAMASDALEFTFDDISTVTVISNVRDGNVSLRISTDPQSPATVGKFPVTTPPPWASSLPTSIADLSIWTPGPNLGIPLPPEYSNEFGNRAFETCRQLTVLAEARQSTHRLVIRMTFDADPAGGVSSASPSQIGVNLPAATLIHCTLVRR